MGAHYNSRKFAALCAQNPFRGDDPAPRLFAGAIGGALPRFPLFPAPLLQPLYPPPAQLQSPRGLFDGADPARGSLDYRQFPSCGLAHHMPRPSALSGRARYSLIMRKGEIITD
jgi:hypothetical protein